MEANSSPEIEVGKGPEKPSRALRRKAELLAVVFGLPKPDTASTSVENMPEEFILPEEMVKVFREIMEREDSNEIEYLSVGDVKRGKIFFSQITKGDEYRVTPSIKDALLEIVGRRKINVHNHPHSEISFSSGDIARFLLTSAVEIDVVIARILEDKYTVSMAIRARENLAVQKERYLTGKFVGSRPAGWIIEDVDYVTKNLETTREFGVDPKRLSAILRHNGCVLYSGVGDVDSKNLRVFKKIVDPYDSTEFEKDSRTKLMLPKL